MAVNTMARINTYAQFSKSRNAKANQ